MEKKINRDEKLYRAVKRSKPDWLTNGKPMPNMFKDEGGNSVDRDGKRDLDEIISFMKEVTFDNKRLKAVVELSAKQCIEADTIVEASPTKINPYHANIILSDDEKISSLQALILADSCKLVFSDDKMPWVYNI